MTDRRSDELVLRAFAKLDKIAFGVAIGVLSGAAIFAATAFIVFKGGDPVGPRLWLLVHYFPGYSVSYAGALVGLLYGFLTGFSIGFVLAALRNTFLFLYTASVRAKAELNSLNDFIDHV